MNSIPSGTWRKRISSGGMIDWSFLPSPPKSEDRRYNAREVVSKAGQASPPNSFKSLLLNVKRISTPLRLPHRSLSLR